jgi:OOP family OmpA-OmpF porin
MNLGMRRAVAAKERFVKLGITSPINTVSMGETQYAAPNSNPDGTDNEAGRQKNRRVNFKLSQ